MALIPILGVPSTFRVPGQYVEVVPAQGPSTAAAAQRTIIVVAPKLTGSGNWQVNTVYEVTHEKLAIDGSGSGCPLHRALRRILRVNKTTKLYALPYAETSGGSPIAAAVTVTYTTNSSGTGVTKLWVDGEEISAGLTASSTPTTVGDDIVAGILARPWLPVTAANVAGTVTIIAKLKGKSQGDGTTGVHRVRAEIDPGLAMTVTVQAAALGLGAAVDGVEGSTTEATNLQTALATIASARYYYVVTTCWHATELGHVKTHISQKSEPIPGLRSVAIAAYTGALASGQTLATGLNYERLQIAWQLDAETDHAELAGNMAAIRQKYEELTARFNFDGFRLPDWLVLPAYAQSSWPTLTNQNDAINDGLTPIASDQRGSYVVMSVSTRSKNAAGTADDFRASETHRISICDLFADTWIIRDANRYGGNFALKDDKKLSNGKVDPNQKRLAGVLSPHLYKNDMMIPLVDEFASAGLIQDEEASKAGLRCVIDPSNTGRLETGLELRTIDLRHQSTLRLAEVSPG